MTERLISRRKFLGALALAGSGVLSECTAISPTSEKPSPERSPTPTRTLEQIDAVNRRIIEQAEKGQVIFLDQVLIGQIYRFPWPEGDQAYLATLETLAEDKEKQLTAFLLKSDCLFDIYKEKAIRNSNGLLDLVVANWDINQRAKRLQAEVEIPLVTGVPWPFLNVEQITVDGTERICYETTTGEKLREFLNKIDWQNVPHNAGDFLGWLGKEFLRGVEEGIQDN